MTEMIRLLVFYVFVVDLVVIHTNLFLRANATISGSWKYQLIQSSVGSDSHYVQGYSVTQGATHSQSLACSGNKGPGSFVSVWVNFEGPVTWSSCKDQLRPHLWLHCYSASHSAQCCLSCYFPRLIPKTTLQVIFVIANSPSQSLVTGSPIYVYAFEGRI